MLLKKLIKNCPSKLSNIEVKGLSSDTRKLKKGDLVNIEFDIIGKYIKKYIK